MQRINKLMKKPRIMNDYPAQHLINRGIREAEVITKKMTSQQQQTQKLPPKNKVYFLLSYHRQESTILAALEEHSKL
jgi:dTDP-glucose pyrophosphorylase